MAERGRPVMRDGKRGHMVHVAPKNGYWRFVAEKYQKDEDDDGPRRGGGRSSGRGRRGR